MKFERNRKWLFFLLITLSSLWFSGYAQREINSFRTVVPQDFYDFRVYYLAGQVVRSDSDKRLYSYKEIQDPNNPGETKVVNPQLQPFTPGTTYGKFAETVNAEIGQYLYPPFFSLTIAPLTELPYEKAKIFWHVFLFLLAALSVVITVKFFAEDYLTVALIGGAGIIFAEFVHPMRDLLTVCNIGSLILFLTTAGIWLHKKYPSVGALLFAAAVFIKLTPIIIVPLMIVRKQWKWLGAFCFWMILILGISVWQLGWQNHRDFALRLLPAMSDGIPVSDNRSLSTAFYAIGVGKFLTFEEIIAGEFTAPEKLPIVLFKLTAIASLGTLLLFFWHRRNDASPVAVEIFVLTLWSIIFAPVSFKHYYVLSLSAAVFAWLHPRTREKSTAQLALLTAATVMIYSVLPNYVFVVTDSFAAQLLAFMVMPTGVALLAVYLLTLLETPNRELPRILPRAATPLRAISD